MKDFFKSKKNIVILVIAIIVYTVIVSIIASEATKANIRKELQESINSISTDFFGVSSNQEEKTNIDNTTKNTNKKAEFNQNVEVEDYCQFNVNQCTFSKKVTPRNTNSVYTYYEVKDAGNTYVDIKVTIKNLTASPITADEIASLKLKYDNKFEYTSFSILEDGDSNFDYSNITDIQPLTSKEFHFLAEVPMEVETSGKSITALLTTNGNTYEIPIR